MSGKTHRKSPAELEREIERSRSEIAAITETLTQRMEPNRMVKDVIESVGGGGGSKLATQVSRTIRENPVPAAIAAASIGYLIYASQQGSQEDRTTAAARDRESLRYSEGSAYQARPDSSDESSISEELGERADRLKRKAGEFGEQVSERAERYGEAARRGVDRVHRHSRQASASVAEVFRDQPLLLGLVGLGAGALLGAVLPATQREDDLMGSQRDALKQRAEEETRERFEQAKDYAQGKFQEVKRDAEEAMGVSGNKKTDARSTPEDETRAEQGGAGSTQKSAAGSAAP